jgi:hypothetical protein
MDNLLEADFWPASLRVRPAHYFCLPVTMAQSRQARWQIKESAHKVKPAKHKLKCSAIWSFVKNK